MMPVGSTSRLDQRLSARIAAVGVAAGGGDELRACDRGAVQLGNAVDESAKQPGAACASPYQRS